MEEWQQLHVAWTWQWASTTFTSTDEAEEINACEANQDMGVVESSHQVSHLLYWTPWCLPSGYEIHLCSQYQG